MKKTRFWLYTLVFTMPLMVCSIDDNAESVPQPVVREKSATNVRELFLEQSGLDQPIRMGDMKIRLIQDFEYDIFGKNVEMTAFNGNCVKYTNSDGMSIVRKSGTLTWRNFNPGALRHGDFTRGMGAIGRANGFAVFPNEEMGMRALKVLLRSDAYANMAICNAVHKYAPACDNNDPIRYKNHLHKMTGVDVNRTLGDLSDAELDKVAAAIKILEGWVPGREEYITPAQHLLQDLQMIRFGHLL